MKMSGTKVGWEKLQGKGRSQQDVSFITWLYKMERSEGEVLLTWWRVQHISCQDLLVEGPVSRLVVDYKSLHFPRKTPNQWNTSHTFKYGSKGWKYWREANPISTVHTVEPLHVNQNKCALLKHLTFLVGLKRFLCDTSISGMCSEPSQL